MKAGGGRLRHPPSRRRWGQNFLRDGSVADRIVDAVAPEPKDLVLEIGPGEGVLTGRLVPRVAGLAVVEIDSLLASILEEGLGRRHANLLVIRGDALDLAPAVVLERLGAAPDGGKKLRVVGNLPFNISVHLIRRFVDWMEKVEDMTVMVQREVAERLTAQPSNRQYGFLSLDVQFACRVERVLEVGRGAFRPQPKVDAAVVRLTPWDDPPAKVRDRQWFRRLVAMAFRNRRKTLYNNLRVDPVFRGAEGRVADTLRQLGMDPQRRGETFSLVEFAAMADALEPLRGTGPQHP